MPEGFPRLLRQHRTHRRWSQEQLGLEAGVSPRHLSCLETGKARPSREMVLLLAGVLALELRERNALLVSAGFAAVYPATPLDGLAMAPVNRAIGLVLTQQEPYGAVLIDRCWNVLRVNEGAQRLLAAFLEPGGAPARIATNLVRAALHPEGLRPHIVNWTEVAAVVLERVERAHLSHPEDDERRELLEEIRTYPGVSALSGGTPPGAAPVAVLHLRRGPDELRLFTLLTTIGTPLDVTSQELTIESLFPVDEAAERWFRARAETALPGQPVRVPTSARR
ncbi:MAG TPA: helix-turn-helix transcriptional regulator [Archangium sp.]|uniref:helix-turn-helix transcriptional regulator n=1 Tax=Archangium sp. TaxID=1872627 RepID=UPI002E311A38|nr:helix-turn-helix transcriptional regulator [Archangium sp.]HEX5746079.1 helix-turn-helix transcriptional regulator [Archangium sp.]